MARRNTRGIMFALEEKNKNDVTDIGRNDELKTMLSLSIDDFLLFLNTKIQYGFIDKNNKVYKESELNSVSWIKNYQLQTNERLLQTKIGHCWDFVELERFYFDYHHIRNESYFIRDSDLTITHTFLIYYQDNNVYYIESAWYKYEGIRKFNTKKQCLDYVKSLFQTDYKNTPILRMYSKPKTPLTQNEFIRMVTE